MSDRIALITASSRGIGAACATRLAERGYGVVLCARSPSVLPLAEKLGGVALLGDVTREADLAALVDLAMTTFGRIDVVVNNTGDPARGDLLQLSEADWTRGIELLLFNVQRMARLVTPIMLKQGAGSLVNISAADAFEPDARFPIGSTLRAALGAWTKLYADRYARDGIRMNCVLPGIILPDGTDRRRPDIAARVPMGRAGGYDEIARAVLFLASDEASYMTGQNVRVDGGLIRSV